MKNTVIFDLDGLLIDSEAISYRLFCDLTAQYGQKISLEEYIHHFSGKNETVNMRRMMEVHGLPISMEEGLAFVNQKEKEYFQEGVALKQGAMQLLSYLQKKQYKILLASSSTKERAVKILTQNNIAHFFHHMVFGAEVARGKPYPDIFQKACSAAGEPPERCLVLEDSEAGIQAACSAGIDVICIPDLKSPGEKFRKMTVAQLPSLDAVPAWLELS